MTTSALTSLSLTAFRGSSATFRLDFEKGRKLTLVYGENGTGKTTICDGFELLAKGEVGSLKGKGLGGKLEDYWPSANKALSDIEVALEMAVGPTCVGRFAGKTLSIEPQAAKPRMELLRQQQISSLMEAQPADRYKELQRFIDVAGVEQSEEMLRKLVTELKGDLKNANDTRIESLQTLNDQYEAAQKPAGGDVLAWADALAAEPQQSVAVEIKAVVSFRAAHAALASYPDLLAQRQAALDGAAGAYQQAEKAVQDAVATASANASETVELLKAAQAYLHVHPDADACPLCESAEKVAGLSASIGVRLTQLAAVQTASDNLKKSENTLNKAKSERTALDTSYTKSLTDYVTAKAGFAWGAHYSLPQAHPPADIQAIAKWIEETKSDADTWANAESALRQGETQRASVKAALDRYKTATDRWTQTNTLLPNVEVALDICVKTRQSFTESIMAEIAQQVGELYEQVHKGEGLEKIAFQLDPKRKSSMEMQANFSGKEVKPAAYFSQSHLDTLGLCVFLALALRDRPDETVLILDDVLGSVDEPHVERVINMIYGVSAKFRHTIVTTHYQPWREKYRWGLLKPDKPCQFVELTGWTMHGGMGMKSSTPETELLKTMIAASAPDIQGICSKAGVILEAALDFITYKYECRLPRRHVSAYTLGDLFLAISAKLRDALKVDIRVSVDGSEPIVTAVPLKPMLDELAAIAQTRNLLGAHFNPLGFTLPDADAIRFAKQVEQLADALVCPEHGWPSNDNSGSYWRNSGDTRRLHPLKKPK